MIRKVYVIEAFDRKTADLVARRYARNYKTADRIRDSYRNTHNIVTVRDCTLEWKKGAPINTEWIEG